MTTWDPAILTACWADWFVFILNVSCPKLGGDSTRLVHSSYCLFHVVFCFPSVTGDHPETLLSLSWLSTLWCHLAFLEPTYPFMFFVPKPLEIKTNLTSVDCGCSLECTSRSPIKVDTKASRWKDVCAASGLLHQKQRWWCLDEWELAEGRI